MPFYDNILKDDERLVRVIRSFPLTFFWSGLFSLVFLLLPFFIMIPLFDIGIFGLILFGLILFIGLVLSIRTIVIAYFNCLIVTERRVIDWDQRGLFEKVISEADYDKIQDISYRVKGVFGTMLQFGTIQIQTAGSAPVLELKRVHRPQKMQALISDVKRNSEIDKEQNLHRTVSQNNTEAS
jgi:hypothetical protein